MLTIKQITDNTDAVIRGLEKKHFKNAKETIEQVLETNNKRRNTQTILDKNLSEVNSLSKSIGMLMKEGKKDEAETAKNRVAELKEANKALQEESRNRPAEPALYNPQCSLRQRTRRCRRR